MRRFVKMFIQIVVLLLSGEVFGQAAPPEAGKAPEAAAAMADPADRQRAVEFLGKLEQKNADTKTLSATFTQKRLDKTFEDEVSSDGRFWYQAPNKFRASYTDKNSTEIWMDDSRIVNYIPGVKQVDIIRQKKGAEAPVNQMLLGFGVKTAEIEKIFDLSLAKEARPGEVGIVFDSRNLERSLRFRRITIWFDEAKVEPRRLFLENDESDISIDLKEVAFNPAVDASLFEPKWPADADVNDYTAEEGF